MTTFVVDTGRGIIPIVSVDEETINKSRDVDVVGIPIYGFWNENEKRLKISPKLNPSVRVFRLEPVAVY